MIHSRTALCSCLVACALVLSACTVTPTNLVSRAMMARLYGASEVPAKNSRASGVADVNLNRLTNVLSWTVTYSGVTGPVTAGHVHGPAMAGETAAVVVPFAGSLASPIHGTATITAAQAVDLMQGRWYVNLHTAANPGGEIRGQVHVHP